MRRIALQIAAIAIAASTASIAVAQPEPKKDEPTALDPETELKHKQAVDLFNSGRKMMQEAGKLDAACETLAKSYELHKRGDTLLNLAECHRRQKKTATAWREFDEAIRYAEEVSFPEAIEAAKKYRDELAKDLSQLVIDVQKPPKGLEVILDGKPLPAEQWGVQLYVDPGLHTAHASAEGYEVFDGSTEVKEQSGRAAIVVAMVEKPKPVEPKPQPKPEPKPEPKPAPKPPVEKGGVPAWSIIVGATGLALVGVSIGFGVDTVAAGGELDDECGGEDRQSCPSDYDFEGTRTRELAGFGVFVGAGIAGLGATAAGIIGLVAGVTGTKKAPVAITPWMSPTSAGIGFSMDL